MITIEDLLEELEIISTYQYVGRKSGFRRMGVNPVSSPADRKFIQDLTSRTRQGGKFSTKQAFIACKIIKKYARLFSEGRTNNDDTVLVLLVPEIIALCENPNYRVVPYQSTNVPREVRYLGNRKLGLKCKFSPQIIDRIKALKDHTCPLSADFPYFNKKYRIWVVDVTEKNIDSITGLISRFNFMFDDKVVQFLTDCENSVSKTSTVIINDEQNVIHVIVNNNNLLAGWLNDVLQIEDNI